MKGSAYYNIWFRPTGNSELPIHLNSDCVVCVDDTKSTSGCVFSLGNEGHVINYESL